MKALQDRHILHLCWRLAPRTLEGETLLSGGLQKIVACLAADSRSQGASVFVGSNDRHSSRWESIILQGNRLDHLYCPFGEKSKTIRIVARLVVAMRRHRIDLVHCHDRHSAVCGWLASRLLHRPMIYTAHGIFTNGRWMGRCFGRNIVAVSEAVRDNLVNVFGVCPQRVAVIHNGSNLSSSSVAEQRQLRVRLGVCDDDQLVTVVGRLSVEKGHEYLIRALPGVVARYPRLRVLVVGEGRCEDRLRRLAVDLSVGRHVVFCGQQSNVAPFIDISRFTVLPSLREGLGMAIIESFRLGKAVVASSVGGVPEIVKHGANGMLVPPGCPRRLAAAIGFMLAYPDRASRMGREGRKRARTQFSLKAMLQQYRDYYASVLPAGARRESPQRSGIAADGAFDSSPESRGLPESSAVRLPT